MRERTMAIMRESETNRQRKELLRYTERKTEIGKAMVFRMRTAKRRYTETSTHKGYTHRHIYWNK